MHTPAYHTAGRRARSVWVPGQSAVGVIPQFHMNTVDGTFRDLEIVADGWSHAPLDGVPTATWVVRRLLQLQF